MKNALLSLLCLAACGLPPEATSPPLDVDASVQADLRLASQDRPDTVDVGSWNVEWFGSARAGEGPTDEAKQQANVARVLRELDLDVVGLVEVVSESAFARLVQQLPSYTGLLVTDPSVQGGNMYYSVNEQKVALLVHRRFTIVSARVVCTDALQAFAGRPPLEVSLRFEENGKPRTLVVLVAHFKAMANEDGYTRRVAASAALKQYLDTEYPTKWVLTVGDFNDDLDASTWRGHPTPFADFLADAAHYRFTTDALTVSTTVHFSSTIDHHLATNELAARFVDGSAEVLRVDRAIADYGETTSDHYPVLTRYDLR